MNQERTMKTRIISLLLALYIGCVCIGCSSGEKEVVQQEYATVFIHPIMVTPGGTPNNSTSSFYQQVHYYELKLDGKLVHRDQLKPAGDKNDPTRWQLSLGKHDIEIVAEGFTAFKKEIMVIENKKIKSPTPQYFAINLSRSTSTSGK